MIKIQIALFSVILCGGCTTNGVLSENALRSIEVDVASHSFSVNEIKRIDLERITASAHRKEGLSHIYAKHWRQSYHKASAVLCASAQRKGLSPSTLKKCLDLVYSGAGDIAHLKSGKIARIPVGAFWCPRNGKSGIWIIAFRWEYDDIRDEKGAIIGEVQMGHVESIAFDSETLQVIGYDTCG